MTRDEKFAVWQSRSQTPWPFRLLIKRALWSIVEATLFRHSFHRSHRWRAFLLKLFGAQIAAPCYLRRTSRVYYPWNLAMGAYSSLGDDCVIYNLGSITIGELVTISQEAYLCGGTHDYRVRQMPLVVAPIIVKDNAWICARAFVGPGVTVGEGVVVGAAAVVMKDIPDWTVVAGNPAKFIKSRERGF
jgi:putative colanic acid biosynthesis acetyltransferase WcaF